MMTIDFDAVIIGAGPAGSAAAILLARAGWSVALVEKHSFPRRKVCGECLAASNLPLLQALGVGAAFDAAAGPALHEVVLMRGQRSAVADLPAAADPTQRWGRALGRETLDCLLLEQARAVGADILQPWSVSTIRGSAGDWHCQLRAGAGDRGGITLRSPLTIAAHGSWEPPPIHQPIHQPNHQPIALPAHGPATTPWQRPPQRAHDLLAFKANFHGATLPNGQLPVLCLDGGYGGMVVADGGITTLACCVRRDRLDSLRRAAPGQSAGDTVEAWLRLENDGVRQVLRTARREGPWLAAGPIAPGIRLRVDDRVFRLGNAAGEAHPILGEGMSMALQSAVLLCRHLLNHAGPRQVPGALTQRRIAAAYAAEWRRAFTPRLRLAAAFAQLAMRPAAATGLVALAQAWPGLLTLGARFGGKVCSVATPPWVLAGAGLDQRPHRAFQDTAEDSL